MANADLAGQPPSSLLPLFTESPYLLSSERIKFVSFLCYLRNFCSVINVRHLNAAALNVVAVFNELIFH